MAELIYEFIRNVLIGETTIPGADDLATLLTWSVIVVFCGILALFVKWLFSVPFGWLNGNNRRN